MYLQSDTTFTFADNLVGQVNHLNTIQPSLNFVTLNANTQGIPIAGFEDVLFLLIDLSQPATTIRLEDTSSVLAFGSHLNLPAANFGLTLDNRTEEQTRVAVCTLFELCGQVEIVVVLASCKVTVFFVFTALDNQVAVFVNRSLDITISLQP